MKRSTLLSALFFVFGLGILAFSFSSSSFSLSLGGSTNERKPLAKLFSGDILPGNPLYLFLMIKERFQVLGTRNQAQRAFVYIDYAHERLDSTKKLFATKEHQLAISTLAKGQIYLGLATSLYQQMQKRGESVDTLVFPLHEALVTYQEEMMVFKDELEDAQRVRIDQLIQYNLALQSAFPQELRE